MNKINMRLLLIAAMACGLFFLTNCGGAATTTTNSTNTTTTTNKAGNTTTTTTTKTETASTDSVGVPECDEYIKKYEACLTKVAKQAPQVEPSLKSAFEQQRNSFKQAAANPQSKAMLATQCKQAIETVKQSTSAYACEW